MTNWLVHNYDLWRGLHILAVIAWMAGLLILPRLFAYHLKADGGRPDNALFIDAERRVMKIILNPAFVLAFLFGCLLIYVDGQIRGWDFLLQPWMLVKIAGILFLIGWHHYLGISRKRFTAGTNPRSERFWRMTNELPFLAAIVMVIAVTTEFGG